MTIRPVSGWIANWTLEPPVSTPISRTSDGGVGQPLILLVGQSQGRCDRDRVAGVDAHRIDALDGADDDAIVGVVTNLHPVFLPAEHRLFYEDLADRREGEAALNRLDKLGARGCDAAAFAAQPERAADDRRQADSFARGESLVPHWDRGLQRPVSP
jgi:hypothetical protein